MKYWETIANKSINARDDDRRTVWIVDAHRDGRRFIVRADEKLTAFVELQAAIHRQPASSQSADGAGPRCSTQRAGIAPPHAEGDGLSGVTSEWESNAFISGPTAFVGGVPVTRARNPWAMPEAST